MVESLRAKGAFGMNQVISAIVIAALIVSIMAFAGMLYNFQNDSIGFHTHPTHITKLPEPFDDSDILKVLMTLESDLVDQRAEYTREIVMTRKILQDAQIGTGDQARDKLDEQSGKGSSPALTIHLDASEFIKGEIIWISGTGEPLQPIQATITDANLNKRYPNASVDKIGNFKVAYTTDFESPVGTYTVFVKSSGETSQILSFIVR